MMVWKWRSSVAGSNAGARATQWAPRMPGQMTHENLFSQRYGVERRDPFQNEALVKLMLEMPVSMSFRDGMDKWVMREAMRGRMPEKLRTKGRTGLLNSFLQMGFERNREKLKRFLLEPAARRGCAPARGRAGRC